jgi:predicted transcriptional regulator
MLNKRRDKFQIIHEILKLKEASKREISSKVRINSGRLNKYLESLTCQGLLERIRKENPKTAFCITTKGQELLEEMENLRRLLEKPGC